MAEAASDFYEHFWADSSYQSEYAFDAAVRDRFPAIKQVWGTLAPPRRVLDFGSGNGVLSYWMHSNGFGEEVVGLDISETGIRFANMRFARQGLRYEKIKPGVSVKTLGRFDVVISSHVLEHLDKPASILQDMRDSADWFVFEVPLEDALVPNTLCRVRRKDRHANPVGHVQFWNRRSFGSLLDAAGYHVVRDYNYASAPYSPFTSAKKRLIERTLLSALGVAAYGYFMATHYTVLARRK